MDISMEDLLVLVCNILVNIVETAICFIYQVRAHSSSSIRQLISAEYGYQYKEKEDPPFQ